MLEGHNKCYPCKHNAFETVFVDSSNIYFNNIHAAVAIDTKYAVQNNVYCDQYLVCTCMANFTSTLAHFRKNGRPICYICQRCCWRLSLTLEWVYVQDADSSEISLFQNCFRMSRRAFSLACWTFWFCFVIMVFWSYVLHVYFRHVGHYLIGNRLDINWRIKNGFT